MATKVDSEDKNELGEEHAQKILSGIVNDKGYVAGLFRLPEPFFTMYKVAEPRIQQWLAEAGEPRISSAARAAAIALKIPNPDTMGQWAGYLFKKGFPFLTDIGNVWRTGQIHRENKKQVLEELAPLLAANKNQNSGGVVGGITNLFLGGYEGNEMVQYALKLVTKETYKNLTQNAASIIPRSVQLYGQHINEQLKAAGKMGAENQPANIEELQKKADFVENWGLPLSGAMEQGAAKAIKGASCHSLIRQSSLGVVMDLKEYVRQQELDRPEAQGDRYQLTHVAELVEEAFQRAQKEQGRHVIPTKRMKDAARLIAEELVNGNMQVLSLVNIIGKKELLNSKGDGLISDDKIRDALAKEMDIYSKGSAIDVDAFMKELNYSLDDIKRHLQSKDKDEQALVVLLHPDAVLIAAGMKKEDIAEYRKHISGRMADGVFGTLIDNLGSKYDNAGLEEMGFDRQSIQFIRSHEGDPQAIAYALKDAREKTQVVEIARTALMGAESSEWRDLIEKSRTAGKTDAAARVEGEDSNPHPESAPDKPVQRYLDRRSRRPMDHARRADELEENRDTRR